MSLSSLKLSFSWAARALTMPSRSRSWMSRSSARGSAAAAPPTARSGARAARERGLEARTARLATVPPRDHPPSGNLQESEAQTEPGVACRGEKERQDAERHHPGPQLEHRAHREDATGHHRGAIEQQPRSRQVVESSGGG